MTYESTDDDIFKCLISDLDTVFNEVKTIIHRIENLNLSKEDQEKYLQHIKDFEEFLMKG